jgi:hypothetical protein
MGASVAGAAVPAAWAPSDLFTGGYLGHAYDFSDKTKLFQALALTTVVTASGQTIASVQDLSGNGNHLTQSTAGSRPVYTESGAVAYAAFDGVDDFLQSAATVNLGTPANMTVWCLFSRGGAGSGILIESSTSSSSGAAGDARFVVNPNEPGAGKTNFGHKATGFNLRYHNVTTAVDTLVGYVATLNPVAATAATEVAVRDLADAALSLTDYYTTTKNVSGDTFSTQTHYIGARAGTSARLLCRIVALGVVNKTLSAGERASLEAWLTERAS